MVWLIFLISLIVIIIPPPQIAGVSNCLRTNKGVLDANFNLFNKHENVWSVAKEDVAKQMSLFSTRFNRAHVLTGTHPSYMRTIAEGVLQYENESGVRKQLYFTAPSAPRGSNVSETITLWKNSYKTANDIRTRNKDLVVGLYLMHNLPTWPVLLEAIDAVIGESKNTQLPIGFNYAGCSDGFSNSWAIQAFQRLQFITCQLNHVLQSSPEDLADDIIRTCDALRETARSRNISAEIMCTIEYISEGNSTNGIVGSVSDFHRFWCQISNQVARNQTHARIITWSAFDNTPMVYGESETVAELKNAKYHTGWWRRTHRTSYEQSSFVEKVGEMLDWPMFSSCTKKPTLKELAAALGEEMKRQGIKSFPI